MTKFQLGDRVVVRDEYLLGWEKEFQYKTGRIVWVYDFQDPNYHQVIAFFAGTSRRSGEFSFFEHELDFAPQTN